VSAGNGPFDALFQDSNDTGSRVVFGTADSLAGGDSDGRIDLYERAGGTTTLLSTGPSGGNGPFDAFFSAASGDGARVFFETAEQLSADSDTYPDVYERQGTTTTRISSGRIGGNGAQTAVFTGAAEDGSRVWFASAEKLASTDTDAGTDIYEARTSASYVRPGAATKVKTSLVIAYEQCTSPNRAHGPPALGGGPSDPSCHPPRPTSDHLTVGTGETNGLPVRSRGMAIFKVLGGDPGTPADEADVDLHLNFSDVRLQSTFDDYAGELDVNVPLGLVDKLNGATPVDAAAVSTFTLRFAAPCAVTATDAGSTCTVDTTADALVPGMVVEGVRTIWQLGQVEVRDGGPDGVASTAPNTPFLRQGLFVP
jgi:hypothetical protein